jgi:phospholipid transport system substrate-binding protein
MRNLRSLMSVCLPVLALALNLAGPVRADPTPPDVLVRTTSEDVLRLVAEDKDLRNGNSSKLNDLIETRILPQFDMSKMTRLAVGKNWRQATQDQQKQLIKEFQTLLVRSYSAAYSAYRYVKVDVKPLKAIDGEDVTVKTQILLPGGAPPVAVDYAMNVTPDGWKVYNVVVEGVSLVTTYRTEFGAQIEHGGIDGLIRNLQERNSKAAQVPAPLKK